MRCKFPSANSTLVTSLNQSTKIYHQLSENRMTQTNSITINHTLAKKYNTSENYFYQRVVNNALNKKRVCKWLIDIRNLEPDDNSEHIGKYFDLKSVNQQLPTLLEYYKYYGQKAILFFGKYFKLILSNQQRQKIVLYRHLKKFLELQSEFDDQTSEKCSRGKKSFKSTKILNHLIQSKIQTEQSDCFNQLHLCLSQFLGRDQPKSLKQIDQCYDKYRKLSKKFVFQKYLRIRDQNQTNHKKLRKHNTHKSTNKGSLNKQSTQKSPQCFKRHKKNLSSLNFPNGTSTIVNLHNNACKILPFKPKQPVNRSQIKHIRHKSNQSLLSNNVDPIIFKNHDEQNPKKKKMQNPKNRNKPQSKILKQNISVLNFKNDIQLMKAKIRQQNRRIKQQTIFGSSQFFNQKKRKTKVQATR